MKIILLEDVAKLGKAGEVAKVSPGYGRNYLLPKNLAILATQKNLKNLERIKQVVSEKALKTHNALKVKADELTGLELQFVRRADDNGHLYGSVSDIDVVSILKEKGFDIHKNMLEGETHIKNVGTFDMKVHFSQDIQSDIKVIVSNEE